MRDNLSVNRDYVPVFIRERELDLCYAGFCKEVLWPLMHSRALTTAFHIEANAEGPNHMTGRTSWAMKGGRNSGIQPRDQRAPLGGGSGSGAAVEDDVLMLGGEGGEKEDDMHASSKSSSMGGDILSTPAGGGVSGTRSRTTTFDTTISTVIDGDTDTVTEKEAVVDVTLPVMNLSVPLATMAISGSDANSSWITAAAVAESPATAAAGAAAAAAAAMGGTSSYVVGSAAPSPLCASPQLTPADDPRLSVSSSSSTSGSAGIPRSRSSGSLLSVQQPYAASSGTPSSASDMLVGGDFVYTRGSNSTDNHQQGGPGGMRGQLPGSGGIGGGSGGGRGSGGQQRVSVGSDQHQMKDMWKAYVIATERFAETVKEVYEDGDMIWVHGYHLMLVSFVLSIVFGYHQICMTMKSYIIYQLVHGHSFFFYFLSFFSFFSFFFLTNFSIQNTTGTINDP